MTLQEHLADIDACQEAREWADTRTAAEAWEQCERADWLIWWAWRDRDRQSNSLVDLMAATTLGPRRALVYVPAGEARPRLAIEAAEQWAADPTEENRKAARAAAAKAAEAAWAAAWAAWAAGAAAWAAEAAGAAAWAAEAAGAAWAAEHQTLCELIRQILTQPWKEA